MDRLLEDYNIQLHKYYSVLKLYDIMADLGLTRGKKEYFVKNFLHRKIASGEVILPEKKQGSYRWRLSGKDIRGIIAAFIPGGTGHYNFKESEVNSGTEA